MHVKKKKITSLSNICGDATAHNGCSFKVFPKYGLKHLSFFCIWGTMSISKGIQNVKYAILDVKYCDHNFE